MADVFISHVEENSELAIKMADAIETAGILTWHYERDALPGLTYLEQITEAIDASIVMIVLVSHASIGSHQVAKEIEYAHDAGKKFLPVLVDLSQAEFMKRRKDWHLMFGAATSIRLSSNLGEDLRQIVRGLQGLLPRPVIAPTASHPSTPLAPAPVPAVERPVQINESLLSESAADRSPAAFLVLLPFLLACGLATWLGTQLLNQILFGSALHGSRLAQSLGFALFGAWFLVIPGGFLISKVGYKTMSIASAGTMALGVVLMWSSLFIQQVIWCVIGWAILTGGLLMVRTSIYPVVAWFGPPSQFALRFSLAALAILIGQSIPSVLYSSTTNTLYGSELTQAAGTWSGAILIVILAGTVFALLAKTPSAEALQCNSLSESCPRHQLWLAAATMFVGTAAIQALYNYAGVFTREHLLTLGNTIDYWRAIAGADVVVLLMTTGLLCVLKPARALAVLGGIACLAALLSLVLADWAAFGCFVAAQAFGLASMVVVHAIGLSRLGRWMPWGSALLTLTGVGTLAGIFFATQIVSTPNGALILVAAAFGFALIVVFALTSSLRRTTA